MSRAGIDWIEFVLVEAPAGSFIEAPWSRSRLCAQATNAAAPTSKSNFFIRAKVTRMRGFQTRTGHRDKIVRPLMERLVHYGCEESRPSAVNRKIFMAQAVMDPEQVRRFAEELKRFNADLQTRMSALQARFGQLSDSWQDQEHLKFAEEFKQTMKTLNKFMELSNQHGPYLLRKAQRIEEYLNQH
ncbi:MAG: WXG-repeat protein [Verrucomicrobiales bacterium]|nr:WXG-repeat protein [Verrucomicrobiales bacterium]